MFLFKKYHVNLQQISSPVPFKNLGQYGGLLFWRQYVPVALEIKVLCSIKPNCIRPHICMNMEAIHLHQWHIVDDLNFIQISFQRIASKKFE